MTDKVASELLRSLHNASRGLPAPKHAQPVDPYEATKRVREMAQRVSQKLDRSVDTTVHWDVDKDATATSSGMRKDTLIALACSTGGPQALQVLIPYASGRSSGSAGFGTAYAGRIYGFSCQTTGSDKCHPCQAGRGSGECMKGWLGLHCTRRQAYGDRQGQKRSPYGKPQ